jgi:hemoglobin
MRARLMAMVLLAVSIGATSSRGEDKPAPLERSVLDNQIVKVLYDAAALGTEIWNKNNNIEGCFRLYQGTLMAVQPLLKDYRRTLALSVKDKMDRAKAMKLEEGAFTLRAAIDEILNEIAPGPKLAEKVEKIEANKTLWDRLGGVSGVNRILKDVFLLAAEDTKVNFFRGKKLDDKAQANLKQNLLEFISSVTGGPFPYKGKDLKAAHAGMKITDDEFTALGKIVEGVLRTNKISEPDIKEFMGILESTRKEIVEIKSKN